jgi:CheY-like chemotaxis protein
MEMPLSILLVDDIEVNRVVTSRMLRKLGYQADIAENGIEALEALDKKYYDIIFMDIQMPQMDGIEATRIIRERWVNGPKIVIVSALSDCIDACLDAGADDILAKPLSMKDLRSSIEYHMGISSVSQFGASSIEKVTATSEL